MAHRVVLEEDFEDIKKGVLVTITTTKLTRIQKAKIKYTARLKSGVGRREYKFEKPKKPDDYKEEDKG